MATGEQVCAEVSRCSGALLAGFVRGGERQQDVAD